MWSIPVWGQTMPGLWKGWFLARSAEWGWSCLFRLCHWPLCWEKLYPSWGRLWAQVGLLMAWWMDLGEAPWCGSSKGSSESCDHSGLHPQGFPCCASVSSSEELWVKPAKGRDPCGRRPLQDNEFRRQKEGGEEVQSSVRDHTSASDAKTSF